MVDLSPFCSFLLLAGSVVVGVVLARDVGSQLVDSVPAVLGVHGVGKSSARPKTCIGVGRVRRKGGHPGPVGRGRGGRNQVHQLARERRDMWALRACDDAVRVTPNNCPVAELVTASDCYHDIGRS